MGRPAVRTRLLLEAIKEYPTALGETAWQSIGRMILFLTEVRRAQVPIVYTRVLPRHYSRDDYAVQIVEPLAPQPNDAVIDKPFGSAFFSTRLEENLERYRADTLIIIGNSTSGCVRATVVDAQHTVMLPSLWKSVSSTESKRRTRSCCLISG